MINPTQISWTGSNEREDGSPYTPAERRGYNVYIFPDGSSPTEITFTAISEAYDFSMPISDLGNPLDEGMWEMSITDVDKDGRESAYSAPVQFEVKTYAPKPPTQLSVS